LVFDQFWLNREHLIFVFIGIRLVFFSFFDIIVLFVEDQLFLLADALDLFVMPLGELLGVVIVLRLAQFRQDGGNKHYFRLHFIYVK